MALFFDTEWFDARLAERGLSRAVLASVSGMTEWAKDGASNPTAWQDLGTIYAKAA